MKKAIVIGATSGIGQGLAKALVENNYKVGICGRRTEKLLALQSEYPDAFLVKTLDVTSTAEVIDKLKELMSELGGLDLLILSSGTGDINNTLSFDIEQKTIETNVTGFTCIVDWTYNIFEKQEHGQLVAISSIGGLRGSRNAPAYNASKAYQINYLEGLRKKAKHSQKQIHITDISPGLVNTDMAKGEGLFWVMPVDKIVRQIYRAIRKKKKIAYVSKRWKVLAFFIKRMPRFIYDRM